MKRLVVPQTPDEEEELMGMCDQGICKVYDPTPKDKDEAGDAGEGEGASDTPENLSEAQIAENSLIDLPALGKVSLKKLQDVGIPDAEHLKVAIVEKRDVLVEMVGEPAVVKWEEHFSAEAESGAGDDDDAPPPGSSREGDQDE